MLITEADYSYVGRVDDSLLATKATCGLLHSTWVELLSIALLDVMTSPPLSYTG